MVKNKEQCGISEEQFFGEIYKNAKMGADSIIHLLPHIKDDELRSAVTQQLDGYEKYAARAAEALAARGIAAKEENLFTRLSARMGVALNTMLDESGSHIAEMMIEGSNMAITEMTKLLNDQRIHGDAKEASRLAEDVVRFEERNLEILKRYL